MRNVMRNELLELGRIVVTKGIHEKIASNEDFVLFVTESLKRHQQGDWGQLCEEDKLENESSLQEGLRIVSRYEYGNQPIWIITEANRSVTTVLFPEEY